MSLDVPPLTSSFTGSSPFSFSSTLPTTGSPSEITPTTGSSTNIASTGAGSSTYSLTLSSGLSEPISGSIETSSRGTVTPSTGTTQESSSVSSVGSTKSMESSIRSDSSAGPTTSSAPVVISPSEPPRGTSTSLTTSIRTPLSPSTPSSVVQPTSPTISTMSTSRAPGSSSRGTSASASTGPSRPPMGGGPATTPSPPPPSVSSSPSGSSNTAAPTSRSTSPPTSSSSSSRTTASSSSRPPVSSPAGTVTSVVIVAPSARATSSSTSTLFVDPQTTLESAIPVTITSDDTVITSTPEFVTIVRTSTEPDGDLVVHTEIAANPNFPSRGEEQSRGILDNKGAAAGIFVTIGVVTSVVSVILFMIWRKRRRNERRKQWFAGMRETRAGSAGSSYPFGGDGGVGGAAAAGGGGMSSNRSSGFIQGMASDRSTEEGHERGGNALAWGRQPQPSSHYRTHSNLAPARGYNLSPMAFPEPPSPLPANDSMSSLGLAGIGAGAGATARGFPSPSRKPVSAHLYGDDLKDLDQALQQSKSQPAASNSDAPGNAMRARFGLSPIHETAAVHDDDFLHPSLPVPPSSYQYNPRMAPSPSPSSPSLYPPTLPGDDEGYNGEYSEGYSDEYDEGRRPLSNSQANGAAAPPRPPRSRLRESANGMLFAKPNGEHTGTFDGFTPAPLTPPASQQQHDPSQKAKIAPSLDNLFTRIHGGPTNNTKKDDEDTHLPTPASSTRSPIQDKHQDILMNRKTLLDVRPRSLSSDASSN
ncbi:hypothetical protein BKA70DRAFT_1252109 [Coprinopsis sp. MPI-PUGE-AT-0042]|nr:hypothetical protein BKA70DRAFT_1252109 [Coprinopsis sp. MPI-PUGE-AT-0042]